MGYNQPKGFTLIEMVMVIAIIAVLAVPGAFLLMYLVQDSVFLPNQLNIATVVSDGLDILVEGDNQAKGLRYCKSLTLIQSNRVDFINQDGQTIRYQLQSADSKLYRFINGGPQVLIPYYAQSNITFSAPGNRLFTYYDTNENTTNNPANVRWISITLIGQSGTGAFADWEGQSEQHTTVAVYPFQ